MLEELALQRAAHLPRPQGPIEAPLGYRELRGRLVELPQERGSACLSFLCTRIVEAQTLGEPVVWVHGGDSVFFPPDFAANGVDLASLVVVRAQGTRGTLRAVHHLLHSGAFGMVVMDMRNGHADSGRRLGLTQGMLGRFAHLAEKNGTALVCLPDQHGLGSMASLRVRTRLHRLEPGLFRCDVEVVKDKRRGPGQRTSEIYHAPPGLR